MEYITLFAMCYPFIVLLIAVLAFVTDIEFIQNLTLLLWWGSPFVYFIVMIFMVILNS